MPHRAIELDTLLAQSHWMRRMVRRLVGDPDEAEDVLQETWMHALRAIRADRSPIRAARGERSIRAWLGTVARRTAQKRWRSDGARRRREAALEVDTETPEASAYAERMELVREIAGYLIELDEDHRSAVVLRYDEQLGYDEIARRLDISEVTARKRVSRGLARLRARFEATHGPGWMAVVAPFAWPGIALPTAGAGAASLSGGAASLAVWGVALVATLGVGTLVYLALDAPSPAPPGAAVAVAGGGVDAVTSTSEQEGDAARRADTDAGTPASGADPGDDETPTYEVAGSVQTAGDVDAPLPAGARLRLQHPQLAPHRFAQWAFEGGQDVAVAEVSTDGSVRMRAPAGHYDALIEAPGFATAWLPDFEIDGACEVAIGGVDLAPAARLELRVEDPGQYRVTRVWLEDGISRLVREGAVEQPGDVVVGDLAPGRYTVELHRSGGADHIDVIELGAGEVRALTLDHDEPVRFAGRVVDADGLAIAEARVTVCRAFLARGDTLSTVAHLVPEAVGVPWAPHDAATDAAGSFALAAGADAGMVQLVVRAEGFCAWHRIVQTTAGIEELEDLEIELARGASVHGRVTEPGGSAARSLPITAVAIDPSGREPIDAVRATCDEEGAFALSGLAPGRTYHLTAGLAAGTVLELGRIDIAEPGPRSLEPFVLPERAAAGAAARTRLETSKGAPLAFAVVELHGGNWLARGRTDGRGVLHAHGIPVGSYRVLHQNVFLDGKAATDRESTLRLPVFEGVHGRVVDGRGQPILNAAVLLIDVQKGGLATAPQATGSDGTFRCPVGMPGPFALRVAPNSIHMEGGNVMVHGLTLPDIRPGDAPWTVVLPPAAITSGAVRTADGAPCPGRMVFACDLEDHLLTYEKADEQGRFVLRLPPGAVVSLQLDQPHTAPVAERVMAGRDGIVLVAPR